VLLAADTGTIHFLSDTHEGSTHDKAIADTIPYPLPDGSTLLQDLGFQGMTLAGVRIIQPYKKARGRSLTDEQKAANRFVSHCRVRIEHIICSVKRCRMLKDTIRLWNPTVRDRVMAIGCALHNFRIRLNPWPEYM
jgi:DDE superfamily endonuclease